MTHFTAACSYADYFTATVTVEAETPEQAFETAIAKADETGAWGKSAHSGDPFIAAYAEGADADPWGDEALPVPGCFTEAGEPPLVVVTTAVRAKRVHVAEDRARIRYVRDTGTFTADLHDRPAPHHGQPLVSVIRRADGAPHVTVVVGKVRVLYYEEEPVSPARIKATGSAPAGSRIPPSYQAIRLRNSPANTRGGSTGKCKKQQRTDLPLERIRFLRSATRRDAGMEPSPWNAGYARARSLRQSLEMEDGPIPSLKSLAEAIGEDLALLRRATRPVKCLTETPMVDGVVTRNANENPVFAFRHRGEAGRRFHFCRALAEVWRSPGLDALLARAHSESQQRKSRLCSRIPGAFVRTAKQVVRICGRWRGHRRAGGGVRRFLAGDRAPDRQPPYSPDLSNRHARRVIGDPREAFEHRSQSFWRGCSR